MVPIFDLDDTLYPEREYVGSGFHAVALFGREHFGLDPGRSLAVMMDTLRREGRGSVFDRWLDSHGLRSVERVRQCVRVYRHHIPQLKLDPAVRRLLIKLRQRHRIYVVTDGHKVVQANKVAALKIDCLVDKVYITHRYGLRHAKPSTHCFELIRRRERCKWSEMIYIGDNPAKDFVNLKPLGVKTIRVLTGAHSHVRSAPAYDAQFKISSLDSLEPLIGKLS